MWILCRFDAYSKHNTRETFDEYSVQKKLGIAYPPNNINHWAFAEGIGIHQWHSRLLSVPRGVRRNAPSAWCAKEAQRTAQSTFSVPRGVRRNAQRNALRIPHRQSILLVTRWLIRPHLNPIEIHTSHDRIFIQKRCLLRMQYTHPLHV